MVKNIAVEPGIHSLAFGGKFMVHNPSNVKKHDKHANIKILYTSHATNVIQKKIQSIRLKDEIKFLNKQNEKINNDLYRIYL